MKKEQVEEMKKKYTDFEEYTNKDGYDMVRFNLGEVQVPEEFKETYLKVIPINDKNYLTYVISCGKNQELKAKAKKEREKRKEEVLKVRKVLNEDKKNLKKQLKEALKSNNEESVIELMSKIKAVEEKVKETKLR